MITTEENLHYHQATEDYEHSVDELLLVAWHFETSLGSASILLLLLAHALVKLLTLLSNELTLLLKELFEILLGFVRVEPLALLLAPSGEGSTLRISLSFSHGVVPLSLCFVTENLIGCVDVLESV